VNSVETAVVVLSGVAFVYFTFLNGMYLLLTALAWRPITAEAHARRYLGLADIFASPLTPGISVLVPAFNEEAVIVESVRSLLGLRYPRHEVIVVNDGSTDGTIAVLDEAFDLVPVRWALRESIETAAVRTAYVSRRHRNLVVIDKENGGRSDALNAAIMTARHPYVCVIDADSLLAEDALLQLSKPLLDEPAFVAAAGGTIRIANDCRVDHGRVVDVHLPKSRLPTFQVLEYLRAFLVARVGWSSLNALAIISGAFGLFHRDQMEAVGGYWTSTVGEDFELTLRLHRYLRERGEPYRIGFVADPVCWTEVPDTLAILGRQRRRWQRGTWETLRRHRRTIFNWRYGTLGLLAVPTLLCEFVSPAFWLGGLLLTIVAWAFGLVSTLYFVAFLVVSLGLSVVLSTAAVAVDELNFRTYDTRREMLRLLWYAFAESFGYHQLNDVWRGLAFIDIARGKQGWGAQERRGFAGADTMVATPRVIPGDRRGEVGE
jgi:cellulose synthase/poly-beta-1,6-N-acetylglucosamine synthase-like glycosyltransferase